VLQGVDRIFETGLAAESLDELDRGAAKARAFDTVIATRRECGV
jgi:hypothetical protein